MRLLLTVERYFPSIGGAERVVQRVAEGLVGRGHDVVVVTGGSRSSEAIGGVRVERFPVSGNLVRGIRGDAPAVVRFIRDQAPEVVFNYAAQSWPSDICIEAFLDRPNAPPLVLAPCGFSALGDPDYAGYFARLRDALPRYAALVFHSRGYQDHEFARESGATNRHVIANGADPPPDPVLPRGVRLEPGAGVVATVGSHVRSKGHRDFTFVIRTLRRQGGAVNGLIVAPPRVRGDALRGCHPACNWRALTRQITLVDGRVPATAAAVIGAADVLLLPSAVECAPLVVLEAMAASTAWISYPVGNTFELDGGVVVDGRTAMAAATAELLSDTDARRRLGEEGHGAWLRNHRWPQLVERYETLFMQLVERTPARAAGI